MTTTESSLENVRGGGQGLRIALTGLAVIGMMIGGVLAVLTGPQGGAAAPWASKLCGTGSAVDCHQVLHSRYAKVGIVSVAHLGMAYFFVLACWFGFVGVPNRAGRVWHFVPTVIVVVGAAMSAWFMFVMATRLPAWCTWCVASHGINGLILLLTLFAWWIVRRPVDVGTPAYPSATRVAATSAGTLGVLLVAVLGTFALFTLVKAKRCEAAYLEATNNASYVLARFADAPKQVISVRPDDVTIGPADASHTLVGFFDFQCPHCRQFYLSAAQIVTWFPGRLRVVFKHFPLGKACNTGMKAEDLEHPFACEAAQAFEAARELATADQMQKIAKSLFDLQDAAYSKGPTFADQPYKALAVEAELDGDRVAALMEQGAGQDRIVEDVLLARSIGVKGAGELFLNGCRLANWHLVQVDPGTAKAGFDTQATRALWDRLIPADSTKDR